jgi:hypothetical protein
MDRELCLTALRVLSKFARGEKQNKKEVADLRRNAPKQEANLPIDELGCRMIHRHLSAPECWYRKPSKSTPTVFVDKAAFTNRKIPGIQDVVAQHFQGRTLESVCFRNRKQY